jgi:Putative addiction module component
MSFIEIQHQAEQLSTLEKYDLLLVLSADLKSLSEQELETIQAAEAARRLEDIRSGKTQMVIGNDWRTAISHKNPSRV